MMVFQILLLGLWHSTVSKSFLFSLNYLSICYKYGCRVSGFFNGLHFITICNFFSHSNFPRPVQCKPFQSDTPFLDIQLLISNKIDMQEIRFLSSNYQPVLEATITFSVYSPMARLSIRQQSTEFILYFFKSFLMMYSFVLTVTSFCIYLHVSKLEKSVDLIFFFLVRSS